ncbi:hypothetical protein D3C73_1620920 [compost metagenome]
MDDLNLNIAMVQANNVNAMNGEPHFLQSFADLLLLLIHGLSLALNFFCQILHHLGYPRQLLCH